MLGSIVGDIIGSVFELSSTDDYNFPLFSRASAFTDATVLICATADALLSKKSYSSVYQEYFKKYPGRGYGAGFHRWAASRTPNPPAYNSYGNGSAMRVSPVGFFFQSMDETLAEAKKSAEVTHNHPEGIKGAMATAAAIFLARNLRSKKTIKKFIEDNYSYKLNKSIIEIKKNYSFSAICQNTVPQAITAFLESADYESAIRNAIWLGGDSDTMACITGGIAQAYYTEIPDQIKVQALSLLPKSLTVIIDEFNKKCNISTYYE